MHTRDACSTAANKQDACATSAKPRKRRVLVVDDFDSVRRGIYWELKQTADLECCGEAGSVDEALALLPTLQPDIVVLDLVFKNGKHGLSLLRELRLQKSTLPVLVFTGFGDLAYYALVRCARGARGGVQGTGPRHPGLDPGPSRGVGRADRHAGGVAELDVAPAAEPGAAPAPQPGGGVDGAGDGSVRDGRRGPRRERDRPAL